MEGANFNQADLTAAEFFGALSEQADFVDATLDHVVSDGADFYHAYSLGAARLHSATFIDTFMPDVTFWGPNTTGHKPATLDVDFYASDLQGARFESGMNTIRASFEYSILTGVEFGPGAWSDLDVTGADLSGCTLAFADFRNLPNAAVHPLRGCSVVVGPIVWPPAPVMARSS